MPSRGYLIPALILWFASTGWLLRTKILPALTAGNPPAYDEIVPEGESDPGPVRWSIRWNGQEIGWAENRISRLADGSGQVRSEVQFEQLPVQQLIRDVMGVLGRFAQPLTSGLGPLDLGVLTELNFDQFGAVSHFSTVVDVSGMPDLLTIVGQVSENTLDVSAQVQTEPGKTTEIFRDREFRLPPDALVADTFSPRPRLANLRVGQTWTFQSYRPFMPHSPLQLIEAEVEHEELVEWNGKMVRARKVVFRQDSGSGISSTRSPLSETWVMLDGTVLRQDVRLANLKVQFVRRASGVGDPPALSDSQQSPGPGEAVSASPNTLHD